MTVAKMVVAFDDQEYVLDEERIDFFYCPDQLNRWPCTITINDLDNDFEEVTVMWQNISDFHANEDADDNTKMVPISGKWSAEEGVNRLIIKIMIWRQYWWF